MRCAHIIERRIFLPDGAQDIAGYRHVFQRVKRQQTRAQPVIDIMRIIGNVVGNGRTLRFQRGEACQVPDRAARYIQELRRHRMP